MSQWAIDSQTFYKKPKTGPTTETSPLSFCCFGILGGKVKICLLRKLHVNDFEVIIEMWIIICVKNGLYKLMHGTQI
jgi:hypothetical protein